jgi:hypothetical protein
MQLVQSFFGFKKFAWKKNSRLISIFETAKQNDQVEHSERGESEECEEWSGQVRDRREARNSDPATSAPELHAEHYQNEARQRGEVAQPADARDRDFFIAPFFGF